MLLKIFLKYRHLGNPGLKILYSKMIGGIPWLLMPLLLVSLSQQQPRHLSRRRSGSLPSATKVKGFIARVVNNFEIEQPRDSPKRNHLTGISVHSMGTEFIYDNISLLYILGGQF